MGTNNKKIFEYRGYKVVLSAHKYVKNNVLAVLMTYIVTVNLPGYMPDENCAFVDTNNMPDILHWLTENGLATDTGLAGVNGYCTYPLMKFDLEKF